MSKKMWVDLFWLAVASLNLMGTVMNVMTGKTHVPALRLTFSLFVFGAIILWRAGSWERKEP